MDPADWQFLPPSTTTEDNRPLRCWARWESKSRTTEDELNRLVAGDQRRPRWLSPAMLSIALLVWRLSSCAGEPSSARPAEESHLAPPPCQVAVSTQRQRLGSPAEDR